MCSRRLPKATHARRCVTLAPATHVARAGKRDSCFHPELLRLSQDSVRRVLRKRAVLPPVCPVPGREPSNLPRPPPSAGASALV